MNVPPRYGGDPVLVLDGPPDAAAVPAVRQRRRLVDLAAALSPEELATPSRCDGWRVQDVLAHLTTVDGFWAASIAAGLRGAPTEILATFDPKATPAFLVDAVRSQGPAEAVDGFVTACDAFCSLLGSLRGDDWTAPAETPLGHLTVGALAHHALWDAWVHERDVLVPLGRPPAVEHDEVLASLRYGAGLGAAFAVLADAGREGALVLDTTDPDERVVVRAGGGTVVVGDGEAPGGALVVAGDAVELLEAASVRRPWPVVDPDRAWLTGALGEVFESGY